MGEPQIKELAKTRQITRDITLTSPIDGIVLSRDVSPGQRFEKGTEFYKIADLRNVWITADLFGGDTQFFAPGARVKADRKSTRLNSSHSQISYAVFCLKKKNES